MEIAGSLPENLAAAVASARRHAGHPVHHETVRFWADLLTHARQLKADGLVSNCGVDQLIAALDEEVSKRRCS